LSFWSHRRIARPSRSDGKGQFVRAVARDGGLVTFTVDGRSVVAQTGDSILAAMLTNAHFVRRLEFGGAPRAGFCLMGACQDCWVWLGDGRRARACTMLVSADLQVNTTPPEVSVADNA
jgi:D-hydroxyproline dehydrogenase subunit gamma